MESIYTFLVFAGLTLAIGFPYWLKIVRQRREAERLRDRDGRAGINEPATLHPRIDMLSCIGCGSCVQVCPEDVLGIVDGRAAVVNGMRCISHALCVEVCPVGAITMGFGKPRQGMEIPTYDEHFMSNIEGLYIVGELGGVGLIRNAIEQGKKAVNHIAQRRNSGRTDAVDVVIVGAGPGGLGAALAARSHDLTHLVLEQFDLGGSILHYPRRKLVLTAPVEIPLHGKLKISEISKEDLLGLFESIVTRFELNVYSQQKVEEIRKDGDTFLIRTSTSTHAASNVILALGRRGTPKKLGIPGEDLPKVCYRLIEAETYQKKNILVVGGGDSAIEAAVALARQSGNMVSLSYRRESFMRLKEKNETHINELMKSGKIKVFFSSVVESIDPTAVRIKENTGTITTIPNDFVFIFAGGELPTEFLIKSGIKMRSEDIAS